MTKLREDIPISLLSLTLTTGKNAGRRIIEAITYIGRSQRVTERAMDSNDLEKERGITILAKIQLLLITVFVSISMDTPGHADFGGEVERIMKMVGRGCSGC